MRKNKEQIEALYALIASAKNSEEVEWLLEDICTRKELINMSQRLEAAKLLLKGYTYQQVTDTTSISSATLSRVSRSLQEGKGYQHFLIGEESQE